MNDTPIMLIIRNLYIIFRLIDNFPTLTGDSKQVRDLLGAVRDRLKNSLEQDVYIPLGYPKQ
jgi:hypothetical protein